MTIRATQKFLSWAPNPSRFCYVCSMDAKSCEKATGAIADKYRLSILQELAQRERMTPTDVQELTGLSQPCVSHHVRLLTESDLVTATKEGRNVYLRLNKEAMRQLSAFLAQLG